MGDADAQIQEDRREMEAAQMARVLDAMDDDISHLHNRLHELEERTLRAISQQINDYKNFRFLFLSLNFVLAPVLLAAVLCYLLQQHFLVDGSPAQVTLHTLMMFMIFLSATIGVPMYLGALWAIYHFSVPQDLANDEILKSFLEIDQAAPDSDEISRRDSSASLSREPFFRNSEENPPALPSQ